MGVWGLSVPLPCLEFPLAGGWQCAPHPPPGRQGKGLGVTLDTQRPKP